MFQVVLRDGWFVSSWPNPNPTKLNLTGEQGFYRHSVGPVKTRLHSPQQIARPEEYGFWLHYLKFHLLFELLQNQIRLVKNGLNDLK